MLMARSLLLLIVALPFLTGCVGPNAHGPLGGCCGPIALGDSDSCSGCGELYVDPWINHPADCVDPCDTCGNYNGQSCGKCRPIFEGVHSLWGYKCGNDCGCDAEPTCAVSTGGFLGGCTCGVESCNGTCGAACDCGCAGACDASCGVEACGVSCGCESCGGGGGGEIYLSDNGSSGEYIVDGVPTHMNGVAQIEPIDQPFKPEHQRKIFNPRPRVATGAGRQLGY